MRALVVPLMLLVAGCAAPLPNGDVGEPLVLEREQAGWMLHPIGFWGGEPSVGVTSSGAIFVAGHLPFGVDEVAAEQNLGGKLLRSLDGGNTWELIGDPAFDPKVNNDPWVWVDMDTDRIFNVPLNAFTCPWLAYSDDDGESWTANPGVACVPPSHDHQKLVTGPAPAGSILLQYENLVYYAYNSLLVTGTAGILGAPLPVDNRLGTILAVSNDGGRTFGPGKMIHESGCHRGIIGPPAVAPDGRAYVPHGTCDGVDVMISADAFETWDTVSINDVGSLDDFAFDPGVAVDEDGTAFLTWQGAGALLHLATSADGGSTWTAPEVVSPANVRATVYSSITAISPGRVAVAYAGTDADPSTWEQRASSFAPEETVWHLYVTIVEGGVPTTTRLTSDDDPLQIGCIWMRGGQSDCRNLYDFITIVHRDGTLYLTYTDGCDACTSAAESKEGALMLAKVSVPAPRTA